MRGRIGKSFPAVEFVPVAGAGMGARHQAVEIARAFRFKTNGLAAVDHYVDSFPDRRPNPEVHSGVRHLGSYRTASPLRRRPHWRSGLSKRVTLAGLAS